MRRLIPYCLSLVFVCGLLANHAWASEDHTFGAGSLIIPMDGNTYQPAADGGIYVAYGFVYKLLNRKAADGVTPDPIPVYWIIDDQKVSITAADLTISSTTTNPVAKEYKLSGEISISGVTTSISYSGGPWVIDSANAASAKAIWAGGFQNVNLHVAKAPFTAKVQRELYGRPPKIGLMNDSESHTGGNAPGILQDYLQAAGIVNDPTKCNPGNAPVSGPLCIFDVLTPNEVGGIKKLDGTPLNGKSMLFDYTCSGCDTKPRLNYNLLWVPHWTGSTAHNGQYKSFNPLVGTLPATVGDADDAIMAVRDYLSLGGGLFAECAGIETFETSPYGRFLTKFDLGHNGGTNDQLYVYYNKTDLGAPYAQIGSFGTPMNGFDPQGGHLHNWRPYQVGDGNPIPSAMAFSPSAANPKSTYTQANTGYDATVTVFTYDDAPAPLAGTSPAPDIHNYKNGDAAYDQWHYYVAGHMDGDPANGTVVYLGGHKYVSCGTIPYTTALYDHEMKLTFGQDMTAVPDLSLYIVFKVGSTTYNMTVSSINLASIATKTTTSGDFTVDLSQAAIVGTDITGIHFINSNAAQQLTIVSIKPTWTVLGGTLNTIFDVTEGTNVEKTPANTYASGVTATLSGLIINNGGYASGCTPQGNTGAGIRYVLNTLFQLNVAVQNQFVRSAPVVYKDFLYQGSFDYPAYSGHFRKFQVNADLGSGKLGLKLDTGFGTSGDAATLLTSDLAFADANGNYAVDSGELTGRNIYASTQTGLEAGTVLSDNTLLKVFKYENANLFQPRMSAIAALTLSETQTVINKRYGLTYSSNYGWTKQDDAMGGVEHSAPVIIGQSTLTNNSRPTIAYVGALDGMIHAFKAGTNSAVSATDMGEISGAGKELWAFIPSSQLPKLQYFRNTNVISNYPAVDASLAYSEVPDPITSGQYITVLLATMGIGGNSLVALDVTNPTATSPAKPKVLWERSGEDTQGSGTVTMGNGSKVAIGRVVNLAGGTEYRAFITTALKAKKPCQDKDGVPLTDGSLCGGIQIYAFDLYTGTQKWRFERVYKSGVNDIPGSLALVDVDQNGNEDYVLLGDMEGNLWLLPTVPDYDKDGYEDTVIKAHSTFTDSTSWSGTGIITDINPLYAATRDEQACDSGYNPSTSPTNCYQLGQDQPVGISPTVMTRGGHTILAWATGGAQWAGDNWYYAMYVLDITGVNVYDLLDASGKLKGASLDYKFVLDPGEKTFGAITYSEGYFYFATAFGKIEDVNPRDDVAINDKGNIRGVNSTNKSDNWKYAAGGKVRGSVFVSRGEVYATTLDGKIIDVGSGNFQQPSALNWYKVKSWRQIFNLNTNQ